MILTCLNVLTKINVRYDLKTLTHKNGVEVDLYINRNPRRNICIYFLYGGRWTTGRKEAFRFIAHKFLKAGYHVAIADYRKHPQVKFPAFVEDVAQGLVCARDHFETNHQTTMPLYVMGHSSGAHLGAMLCADPQYLRQAGGDVELIRGFIGISGPYKFIDYIEGSKDLPIMFGPPERYPDSQPVFLAKKAKTLPAMLLIHGEKDKHVLPLNTVTLAGFVHEKTDAKILIVEGLSHLSIIAAFGLPFWPKQTKMMMNAIDSFITQQIFEASATSTTRQAQ